mgnify:CR=1 FL=1
MPPLRFYNVISIAIYAVALALLYTSLPVTDIAYYLASVSLNLVPHLVKYEIKGVEFKGVRLFPCKHYMGLYSLKTGKIMISSKAVDMPDVFLFIKYHEVGHSRQPHDLLYYVSRNLSPFALAFHVIFTPLTNRRYRLVMRFLASLQLGLFALQFTGPSAFIIVMPVMLILSPIVEYLGALLYLAALTFLLTGAVLSILFASLTYLSTLTSFLGLPLLFYLGYTVPSLAYETDADNYAAKMMGERVLTAYKLFIGKEPKPREALLSPPFLLMETHPLPGFEYFRLKRFVKKMKTEPKAKACRNLQF